MAKKETVPTSNLSFTPVEEIPKSSRNTSTSKYGQIVQEFSESPYDKAQFHFGEAKPISVLTGIKGAISRKGLQIKVVQRNNAIFMEKIVKEAS